MALSDTLVFYIISTAASITVVVLGIVYKSKCKVITCCGCLKVERDVEAEERIDEMEINHRQNTESDNEQYNRGLPESKDGMEIYNSNVRPGRYYKQIAGGEPKNSDNV